MCGIHPMDYHLILSERISRLSDPKASNVTWMRSQCGNHEPPPGCLCRPPSDSGVSAAILQITNLGDIYSPDVLCSAHG